MTARLLHLLAVCDCISAAIAPSTQEVLSAHSQPYDQVLYAIANSSDSVYMQGKFKQALPFNAVLSGQSFSGPLQHLPASWLTSTILKLVHHINPAMVVGTVSSPSLLAPLVSMAQCITVSQPGAEPSLTDQVEDMRLLGSHFQSPSGTTLLTT